MRKIQSTLIVVTALFSLSSFADSTTHNDMTPAPDSICVAPAPGDGIAITRSKYRCEIETWLPMVQLSLQSNDVSEEEQAKILNQLRRDIGKKYKDLTPEWLSSIIYCRNRQKYKDPLGPTYEALKACEKKGPCKTDADIISSSMRTGGKDLLLDNKWMVAAVDMFNKVPFDTGFLGWAWKKGNKCPDEAAPAKGNHHDKKHKDNKHHDDSKSDHDTDEL